MVFGGLIRHTAQLVLLEDGVATHTSSRFRATNLPDEFMEGVQTGDSIAVNGVCLTVVEILTSSTSKEGNCLDFDVSEETRNLTTLGNAALYPCPVHVERSLAFGDVIGGHIVSGHVHNIGTITKLDPQDGTMIIHLPPDRFPARPVHKDSITVNGVSLTIAEVLEDSNSVRIALIPHTLKLTLFSDMDLPAPVNIEMHIISGTKWMPSPEEKHSATTIRTDTRTDFEWMLEAVEEGNKGRYTAPPNPWVGAILVDGKGALLAAGHHVRPGSAHAERQIDHAGSWRGCTLYVTLEPCCHHGRTPPCTDFLKEKEVSRVVVGTLDPDPRVAGNGVSALRAAGVEVVVGVAEEQVQFSLRSYLWHRKHNSRPYVCAKLALSQDNCYAYVTDTPSKRDWITGERARCHGHGLRAQSQKIVVGKNTFEMDKPQLNVRYGYTIDKQPEAVVSTRDLSWLHEGDADTVQVLVEGGPELQNDLLQKRLVNEFVLYRSTKHLGLKGIRWMPSFLDQDWKLVETDTFADGDTMQRFIHTKPAETVHAKSSQRPHSATVSPTEDSKNVIEREAEEDVDRQLEYDSVEEAIAALKNGGLVVVMDDAGRENEGDLMMLADRITLRNMKVLLANTTGIVCACITEGRAKQLSLPMMVSNDDNADKHRTKFTVSVDAAHGITTGVSAADRTKTLHTLADSSTKASDLARPGHIFPLIAAPGGLLERRGHTECGVELARMCGMETPVMVISELYDHATGRMMTARQCSQLGLPIIHVEAIKQAAVQGLGGGIGTNLWCDLPLQRHGDGWRLTVINGTKILHHRPAITQPDAKKKDLLIRIHSECYTGDVLGSALCDCGNQLESALAQIGADNTRDGVIVFPPEHEGRGIGLTEKIKAYALQRGGAKLDTFQANRSLGHPDDARTYSSAVFALRHVGFSPHQWALKLLSENPTKSRVLRDAGFDVDVLPFHMDPTKHNRSYLETKRREFDEVAARSEEVEGAQSDSVEEEPIAANGLAPLKKISPKPWELTDDERQKLSKAQVCIVQAEWHRHMSDMMVDKIIEELKDHYGLTAVEREFAPGSFELPKMVQSLSRLAKYKNTPTVFIAVGVLVKGETDHYDLVATETNRNLASIQLNSDSLWAVNAVLACHNMKQVLDRCDPASDHCVAPHMAHATARLAVAASRE